ncbi:MAG: twin-arginine translocation signal domain-containing protein, partial [Halanaeroarchaeum sp.]
MADDDPSDRLSSTNRRRFIQTATASGVALTTGLAGCTGNGGGDGGTTTTTANGGTTTNGGGGGDKSPIKVGAIYPLSGNLAQLGQESLRGVELAVEQRNNN